MESLISRDKATCFGRPRIRGHRLPVFIFKDMYAGGEKIEHLASMFDLSIDQVKAAINHCRKNKIK